MGDAPTTRIRCTLPNASHLINGVRFGTVTDPSGVTHHVSELVELDEKVQAMLSVPGFERVPADAIPDDVVDAAIAQAAAAAQGTASDGGPSAQAQQTIEDMYRANRALSDELTALRASKGDPALVSEKDAEISRLRADLATAQTRVTELEQANTDGSAALGTAQARVTELEQANAALAAGGDKGSGAADGGDGGAGAATGRRARG